MKVVDIVGARPQFVKLAPVLKALERHNREHPDRAIQEVLVHTGQHYDYEMSQVFFDELDLKAPDYHLGVGSGSHAHQTGEMLKRIEEVLIKEGPNLVVVYGDTNSTLAGALAAAKLGIPVAHVEAGLRSFNREMPEEINRVLADHLSALLFCPTRTAVENLRREGIIRGVHLVGDVMYDALIRYADLAERKSSIMGELGLTPGAYALATVHRAESTDRPERLEGIFRGLAALARDGLTVVVPLHPRTRKALSSLDANTDGLTRDLMLLEPVSYLDMLVLEKNARLILTDSGGVQKEAFFFRVPCLTLREETEWVETVETGWNTLVGWDPQRIACAAYQARPGVQAAAPYGDGRAAERIVEVLGGG
ncbi:MAG: non-hydrolyzing UDP-N-acetylglucosamine 2-epimerase [Moorellales bacterium]